MTAWVITFPSIYHAFRAKKILKEQGIAAELVPIPRELSGACEGLAARLAEEDVPRAAAILGERGVTMVKAGVPVKTI